MPVTYGRSRTARYGNFPHLGASGCHLYRRSLVPCSPALALISARAEGVSTLVPLCCMPCMLTMSPVVALLCSLQVIGVCLPSPLQIQTSSGYEPCALTCVVVDHSCAHLYHHRRRTPSTPNPCKLPCSQPPLFLLALQWRVPLQRSSSTLPA